MRNFDKTLLILPTIILVAITILIIVLIGISKETKSCKAKGGVLIPRTDMCIDKRSIK